MKYVLIAKFGGVNEIVTLWDTREDAVAEVVKWNSTEEVTIQDFGYKSGWVSENGNRCYEIFAVPV